MKSSHFYQDYYADIGRRFTSARRIAVLGDGFVADLLLRVLVEMGTTVSCYRRSPILENMIAGVSYYKLEFDSPDVATYHHDVVVNAMANTNTSQTLAAREIQDQIQTNVSLPINLALLSKNYGKHMIHISTACLHPDQRDSRFEVTSPILQAEGPYYATKLLADTALRNFNSVSIVRPRLIYDDVDHPKNLLTRLPNYKTILDCAQSLTCRQTLVAAICYLVDQYLVNGTTFVGDVVDVGRISLTNCTSTPQVELVKTLPCNLATATPTKVAQTDLRPLITAGFQPISVHEGIDHCLSKLGCQTRSQTSKYIHDNP